MDTDPSISAPSDSSEPARRLRLVAIMETVSFLVLLGAMIAGSDVGVSIAGAIHGLLFLGYAVLVLLERETFGWGWGFVALAILTGPVGAIIVLEKLRRVRT